MKHTKGEYTSRIIKVDHPNDTYLPESERRVLFEYQIKITNIDNDLVEEVKPGKIEYKLK